MDLGFFNKYPYTDFHELNLDWIIEALKRYTKELQDFVQINAIKYADPIQWDIQRQYEKNTVVIDPLNGTAYISVQAVPAGISLARTDYWTVIFDLSLFITAANNNFTVRVEPAATTTATFATAAGEWLVWDQKLYKANVNITAGDAYVEGSNITRWTVEEGLQILAADLTSLAAEMGTLSDLTTTDKSSIVNAINELVSSIAGVVNSIGDLSDLTTVDQSSIVNAINELVSSISSLSSDVGNLANLTTVDQSSIVNAINELVSSIAGITVNEYVTPQQYGAVGDGITDDSSAFQDAIDTGKPVLIPSGTYVISSTLSLPLNCVIIGLNMPVLIVNQKAMECNTPGYFVTVKNIGIQVYTNSSIDIVEFVDVKNIILENVRISNYTGATTPNLLFTALKIGKDQSFSGYIQIKGCSFDGLVGADLDCTNASITDTTLQGAATGIIDRCEELNVIGCAFYNFTGSDAYVIDNNFIHYLINCYCEPIGATSLKTRTEAGKKGAIIPLGGKREYSSMYTDIDNVVENNSFYGDTMRGVSGQNLLIDNWGELTPFTLTTTSYGACWRGTYGYGINIKNAAYLIEGRTYTLACKYTYVDGANNRYLNLTDGVNTHGVELIKNASDLRLGAHVFTCVATGFYDLVGSGNGANHVLDIYSISLCEGQNYADSTEGKISYPVQTVVKGTDDHPYDITLDGYQPVFRRHDSNDPYGPLIQVVQLNKTTDSVGKFPLIGYETPDYIVLGVSSEVGKYCRLRYYQNIPYVFVESSTFNPETSYNIDVNVYYIKLQ